MKRKIACKKKMKRKEKDFGDIHTCPAAVTKNTAKTEFTSILCVTMSINDFLKNHNFGSGWNF